MTAALAATWIGDIGKEFGEGTHVFCTQPDLRGSVVMGRVEYGPRQVGLDLGMQRSHKHAFGGDRLRAVAFEGGAKAARVACPYCQLAAR
ncbi:MAG: hypothetical protein ACRERU_06850, partial [Methylococcales bacterium]